MNIAIMSSPVFHELKELHGADRVIWGGAERYLLELCKLFDSLGHSITIYQQSPVDKQRRAMRTTKTWRGFTVEVLPSGDNANMNYGTYGRFNAVFNEQSTGADLRIYFVNVMCYPEVVHPCISISHGIFWDWAGSLLNSGGEDYRSEFLTRLKECFMAADVCVAVDSNVKNVTRAMFPGRESRIRVIRNFVDTKLFYPDKARKDKKDKIRVLFPRRFTNIRGVNEFLTAVEKYKHKCEYIAVGQANDTEVEQYVKKLTGFEYIFVEPEDMPEVYRKADIALIPTKGAEGLSLSLLESLASGCAVVCTSNGGLMDAVIPGYNAVVYDPQHENIVESINTLVEDDVFREELSKNAVETARCFDIQLWKDEWTALIGGF